MKVGFFLYKEKHPHEGVVRPFINWAKELSKADLEVHFLLLNCGKELKEFIKSMSKVKCKDFEDFEEMVDYLNREELDIVLTDDAFFRLKILARIKNKTQTKTGVYVQILFGIHAISDVFNLTYLPLKNRMLFEFVKILPFSFIKTSYKNLLQQHDLVIANSSITATLLHILYGIESDEIIYPPVDTKIFRPYTTKKKNQVLLYLGSHAGDTNEEFAKEICKILMKKGVKTLAMGNKPLAERLSKELSVEPISGVSDKELAKIYSEGKLTICPQKWEQFGYVVAESIACGTPVLALNYMGPKEIIEQTGYGLLANSKEDFLNKLENFEKLVKRLKLKSKKFLFDSKESSKKLLEVVESV